MRTTGLKTYSIVKVSMRATFLYPTSGISPHYVHEAWAMSVCEKTVKTPMGIGKFDIGQIPESDVLLLESLYCLPFAARYKKAHPTCKIISIIADTSFWEKKLTLARKLFYKLYLRHVAGFIAVSDRIRKDAHSYTGKPVITVRPFLVNKYAIGKRKFNKNILFIGNDTMEKGFLKAIEAVKSLPDFDLYLVGTCSKKIPNRESTYNNIHVEGKVPSLKKYFKNCTYYVHPADFDPSPVTVWEAMYAGLIPIISEDVGQSELFNGMLKRLVLHDVKPETIRDKLIELDKLSPQEKARIIVACRMLAMNYTEKKSVSEFGRAVSKVMKD
jgi:glycosyltransferase involved in cell wall biosynthesis